MDIDLLVCIDRIRFWKPIQPNRSAPASWLSTAFLIMGTHRCSVKNKCHNGRRFQISLKLLKTLQKWFKIIWTLATFSWGETPNPRLYHLIITENNIDIPQSKNTVVLSLSPQNPLSEILTLGTVGDEMVTCSLTTRVWDRLRILEHFYPFSWVA